MASEKQREGTDMLKRTPTVPISHGEEAASFSENVAARRHLILLVAVLSLFTANSAKAASITDVIGIIRSNCSDSQSPFCNAITSLETAQPLNAGNVTVLGTLMTSFRPSPLSSRLLTLKSAKTGMFVVDLNGTAFKTPIKVAALGSTASDAGAGGKEGALDRMSIYLSGTGSFGSRDNTYSDATSNGEIGFDSRTGGVNGGVEYRFTNNLLCGIAGGYSWTDADLRGPGGNIKVDGYNLSLYGTYYLQQWYFDAAFGYGQNDFDQRKNIGNGTVIGIASSRFDGRQYSFSLGTGYDFTRGGLAVGPYARVNYLRTDLDGYTEKVRDTMPGSSAADLGVTVASQEITSLISDVGGRASYSIDTTGGTFVPYVQLGWEHEYENDSRDINQYFNEDASKTNFSVRTDAPDREYFNLGVGISASFARGITAFLDYNMPLGFRHVDNHIVKGGLRFQM